MYIYLTRHDMKVVSLQRCHECSYKGFLSFLCSISKTEFSHFFLRNLLIETCVNIPHVLEVLDCPDPELEGGVLVTHHQGVVVHLEGGDSPHVTHALLHCLVQRDGLVSASDQHHHLPCIHHSANTHGESLFRHSIDVASKEPGISYDGVLGQGLHPCP